ncbi:unnamed protein product, partial [Brenthis ino]
MIVTVREVTASYMQVGGSVSGATGSGRGAGGARGPHRSGRGGVKLERHPQLLGGGPRAPLGPGPRAQFASCRYEHAAAPRALPVCGFPILPKNNVFGMEVFCIVIIRS